MRPCILNQILPVSIISSLKKNLGTEKPLMKTWLLLELLFNTFND